MYVQWIVIITDSKYDFRCIHWSTYVIIKVRSLFTFILFTSPFAAFLLENIIVKLLNIYGLFIFFVLSYITHSNYKLTSEQKSRFAMYFSLRKFAHGELISQLYMVYSYIT